MTVSVSAQYLLNRIADVRAGVGPTDGWAQQDIKDVAIETLEHVRRTLRTPALDAELVRRSEVDVNSLKEGVVAIRAETERIAPEALAVKFGDGTEYDWKERLESLDALVESLSTAHVFEELEVLLRLGMVGDAAFAGLLVALPQPSAAHEAIEKRLREKVGLLDTQKAIELWSSYRAEIDPSVECHIELDTSVAPAAFFDFANDGDGAREKIARYLAKVRPALKRAMIARGRTRFVGGLIGIASILSWTATPSTHAFSTTERVAMRSLGRISHAWPGDRDELAQALGVPTTGYFVGGRAEAEAKRTLTGPRDKQVTLEPTRLLDELTKIVRITDVKVPSPESPVERALFAHKMSLEVVAGDVRAELRRCNELQLQRRLCRFFFERDIRAFGTKIGWSELDVRAEDGFSSLLIEAKKVVSAPSVAAINKWLTQLGSYMDQEHRAARGVLVLYNFTDLPIFAPKETLQYRYLLVVINLCTASPSKRSARIEVSEGDHENPLRLVRIGTSRPSKPKRSTAKARATPRRSATKKVQR